jgi:hypothetical protein
MRTQLRPTPEVQGRALQLQQDASTGHGCDTTDDLILKHNTLNDAERRMMYCKPEPAFDEYPPSLQPCERRATWLLAPR